MGHQFTRAVAAAAVALTLAAACGGATDTDASPRPVLDNARELVATVPASPTTESAGGAVTEPEQVVAELPAPDPSLYDGSNRVVNLWVGPGGTTEPVDVWGRRTFSNGPILLVEELPFGAASDYFAAPPGYSLVVVGAGAGPDGEELAGMFNAARNEQITMIFTNDDPVGGVWAPNLWEASADQPGLAPEPPRPGMGLVYLYAPNTRSFDDSLTAALGGSAFFVGSGPGACTPQRIEQNGFQASVLGGTQDVQLELAPGPATITLHPWFSPDECDQPPVLEFTVDVPADGIVLVLVYSPDGESIATLQLPVD